MNKEYRRLPGKGRKKRGILGFMRLYLGKDHLLCVYNSAYTEDYRRFYFSDIQAIAVAVNTKRERACAIYGGIALFLLLLAFWKGGYWAVFFLILAGLFLINVAVSWFRGPTCNCILYTAASREELTSLSLLKNALKVTDILQPLIDAAQGRLSPDEVRAKAAASKVPPSQTGS
jgi:hypothetical protein